MNDTRTDVTRAECLARDGGKCQRCGRAGDDAHHRCPKGRGGQSTWANLITLCRVCHDWCHANETLAWPEGFLLPSSATPALVPVIYWDMRGLVLLGDDSSVNEWHADA